MTTLKDLQIGDKFQLQADVEDIGKEGTVYLKTGDPYQWPPKWVDRTPLGSLNGNYVPYVEVGNSGNVQSAPESWEIDEVKPFLCHKVYAL